MQTILICLVVNILATLAAADNDCQNCPQDCVQFHRCPEAVQMKRTMRFDNRVVELFKSSSCGASERNDMILCNNVKNKYAEILGSTTDTLPPIDQCGNNNPTKKIVGGQEAELEDFPWMALIRTKNETGHINIICAGSLITEKYVLTAAHCLDLRPLDIQKKGKLHSVILGEHDIRTDIDCVAEDDCAEPVQEFSIHSYNTYHTRTQDAHNDIGLVRLNKAANLSSDFVKLICLPTADFSPLKKDDLLWISGWGRTEKSYFSNIKLKGRISYLTGEDCYETAKLVPQSNEICAGSNNGTDACHGDSGGPLMVERIYNNDTKIFVVGIVSYGFGCGKAGIYTNVFEFKDWILENITN